MQGLVEGTRGKSRYVLGTIGMTLRLIQGALLLALRGVRRGAVGER